MGSGHRGRGGGRAWWASAMPLDIYRFLSGYYLEGDCSRLQLLACVFSDQAFG